MPDSSDTKTKREFFGGGDAGVAATPGLAPIFYYGDDLGLVLMMKYLVEWPPAKGGHMGPPLQEIPQNFEKNTRDINL